MSIDSTIEKLLFMEKNERKSIVTKAWNNYTKLIADIAHDIYLSCIQDFYNQYDPVKYKRHGYPEGKNLYQADAIEWTESELRIRTAANQLWKYGGKKDKRSKVLTAVMNGERGSRSKKTPPGWPMEWRTTYPNDFSDFFQWDGIQSPTTMQEIMDYFSDNVMEETEYIFWEYLDELI
jgi:hypothetical protein